MNFNMHTCTFRRLIGGFLMFTCTFRLLMGEFSICIHAHSDGRLVISQYEHRNSDGEWMKLNMCTCIFRGWMGNAQYIYLHIKSVDG